MPSPFKKPCVATPSQSDMLIMVDQLKRMDKLSSELKLFDPRQAKFSDLCHRINEVRYMTAKNDAMVHDFCTKMDYRGPLRIKPKL